MKSKRIEFRENQKKLIDNAFKLGFNQGKEQAEKEFLDKIRKMQDKYALSFGAFQSLEELKNQIGGKTR